MPYDVQVVLQLGFGYDNGFLASTTTLASVLMWWVELGPGHEIKDWI